jgi:multidrug transporter EmrE-like cation transporter
MFFILVLLATAAEVVGDIYFKKWSLGGKNILVVIGFIIYGFGTILWAFSLKYEFLSKAISILTLLNLIIVVLVGVLYFDEKLTFINKLGVALGIVSIVLIEV